MDLKQYLRILRNGLQGKVIPLDYPWKSESRFQQLHPISHKMQTGLEHNFQHFSRWKPRILNHLPFFKSIPLTPSPQPDAVYWQNNYLPGLDLVSLYTIVLETKPTRILEIGSGHSTAVMRKAIADGNLNTKITCIDPNPRRDLNALADEVIPLALEQIKDLDIFLQLKKGDLLFFDGSHLALAYTDVTLFFMEVIPLLARGVVIQIHDIYLPFDYPDDMAGRGYNEQYLLAQLLYFGWPEHIEILFPAYWMSRQLSFQQEMDTSLWSHLPSGIERHGGSFWFTLKD